MRATPRVFPQGGNYVSRRIVTIRQDIVRSRDAGDLRMRAGKIQGKRQTDNFPPRRDCRPRFSAWIPKPCKCQAVIGK